MGPLAAIGIVLLGIAIFFPQYWVQHVITKHGVPRSDFPGTGGELAAHLIEELKLEGVGNETTQDGDHYDPSTRTV